MYEILNAQKRDKVVIDPKKLINMFLNEEPEEVLYNSIDIKFDNIDTVTLMFVEILLKNKFIKLKEYNDDTKIAKFNALNLVKLENSIYYINKIISLLRKIKKYNIGKSHIVLNLILYDFLL